MSKFKISIFIISTFYFLLSTFYFADAASPQFLVNWQSKNFSPSWYQGKIFPTKDSTVEVSFELMDNNKIADLSKKKNSLVY